MRSLERQILLRTKKLSRLIPRRTCRSDSRVRFNQPDEYIRRLDPSRKHHSRFESSLCETSNYLSKETVPFAPLRLAAWNAQLYDQLHRDRYGHHAIIEARGSYGHFGHSNPSCKPLPKSTVFFSAHPGHGHLQANSRYESHTAGNGLKAEIPADRFSIDSDLPIVALRLSWFFPVSIVSLYPPN